MENVFALLFLASLILLVVGIFSPSKSLFWYKKERTRKKSASIYGIAIIAFAILGAATSDKKAKANTQSSSDKTEMSNTSSPNDSSSSTNNASSDEKKPQYNKIGDQIEVGNFSYVVNSAKFTKTVGNEYDQKTADGYFLVISVTFRNNDKEEHTLDNSFFKLTDDAGTEFSSSTDGETSLEMSGKQTLFLKQCNPQITKSGLLIFEVPKKDIYDIHLSGGFWDGHEAIVKLTSK